MNAATAVTRAPRPSLIARLVSAATGPDATAASDPQAYRLLVDSLFSSPTSLILSNTVGALVPVFCWYVSGEVVFLWLAALAGIIVLYRVGTILRYREARRPDMSAQDVWTWDREYFAGATCYSLVLGAANFIALAYTESVAAHIITVVCGIAFSSGYVARNSGRPRFVIVQLACFCAPMVLGLALAAEPYYGLISLYIVLYAVTNVSIVFSLHRNLLALAATTKRAEGLAASLQHQNVTLDSALNSMTHGLCMFSPDLRLEVSNVRFLELYGLAKDDVLVDMHIEDVLGRAVRSQVLTPPSAADLVDLCRRVAGGAQPGEREIVAETGEIYVLTAELTADGGILLLTEDATARKAAAAQIERMAHSDTLTGIPNRFRFGQILNDSLDRLKSAGQTLALLYIDLDNFKVINDTMGHEAGDALLVKVAERLQLIMDHGGVVGRFGGDEFLLLVTVESGEEALAFGRRVLADMSEPFEVDGKIFSVTASVGVALGPEHGGESSELLRSADMALYAAKAEGRNTVVLYAPRIAEALHHRRALETDLREAARSGGLFLHYQPIVDARTNVVRSYEALMRWNHPTKGPISPAEFIPIAEQTGLIVAMGAWALRQACMDAARWPGHITVAVNVSVFQFKESARLIETVKDALLISGLSPSRLEIEVTESLLIADQEATLEMIRTLRRVGVRFSLDDFGSGYSSLGYLARYPFSKVKIDRSFAEHLTSDSPSRSIIEVVCQLAQKLGMRVVVEGIETEAQRREIVALGAEQAQGWLFGRPQPIERLLDLHRDRAA